MIIEARELMLPSTTAVPAIINKKPVYIGCRTNRYGPRWINSCPSRKVTVALQLVPRDNRDQIEITSPANVIT